MIIEGSAKSLEERVFETLEEEILSGKLGCGEALTELSLSGRLGVSRTPIRGALQRLADEGLVDMMPNRGAVVVGVTERDLIDIYKIRMRLEGLAAATAAERMSDEDKRRLSDSVELAEFYVKKDDTEHLKELDTEFHSLIYRATDSRMLSKMLSNMHKSIKSYRKMSLSVKGRHERSIEEHRGILNAILDGNASLADRLTSEHISAALDNILSSLNAQKQQICK